MSERFNMIPVSLFKFAWSHAYVVLIVSFVLLVLMIALYAMSLFMHLVCNGHVSLFLQLQLSALMTCGYSWLCTLVFEIYFSTLNNEAISIREFFEKHPHTMKGQLFEEFI